MANGLLAFGIYLFLSLIFFARILPGHLFDYYVGRDTDPSLYMWSIAWWPYVLRHHAHPFLTSLIWAPHGLNLAWVTCLPLLGVVATPLTTTLGPLATFNIIALLLPPLAAFTAFLLCRRLSGSFFSALLGGFLFGFSPYVIGQLLSHINLILIFPIPLIVYLVARRVEDSLTRASFLILLTLALSMQFLLVLEPFAAMTFVAGVMLLVALRLAPAEQRGRVLSLIYEVAIAYLLTAVLMSPYIYFFFAYGFPHQPLWSAILYSADLLNFVVPTSANAIGNNSLLESIASTFPGNIYEQGACIGMPLIAIATIWARRHRGEFLTKFLIATVVVSCVLACGPFLRVAGHPVFPMPWLLIEKLPLIKSALPVRLVMYGFLSLSVVFAMWLCDPLTGRSEKIMGVVATIVMLMPNPAASFWASRAPLPMFFRDGSSSRLLSADDIVLPLPYGQKGMCMLWQAASGMNFRMASALSGIQPIEIRRWPIINLFSGSVDLPEPELQLKAFVANLGITAIVIDASDPHAAEWKRLLSSLAIAPQEISGVLFYRIPPSAMAEFRAVDPDAAAIEMERRADRSRFETLIGATDRYLASGGAIANLNVHSLETSRLFPPHWKFDPKPDAYRDIWSGEMDQEIGVGVVGSPSALKPIIDSYQADATKIYFPFPREWSPSGRRRLVDELIAPEISGSTSGESIHLLVMTFDPAHLRQVAARISSSSALSLAVPPREASR
ncbi:MAG TPA: hypothetical protein VN867_05250 [Candidatus Binataceae bacterium]|nr:hypothetical protein [Candidatus Binataceae bacterium]